MTTAFFFDEKTLWHFGGAYASVAPVGGLVQPLEAGGLPESPETKRRFKNLMDVTGLTRELAVSSAPMATREELIRVHTSAFIDEFKRVSDAGGGELGLRAPFGPGGFEIAALSAGLAIAAAGRLGLFDMFAEQARINPDAIAIDHGGVLQSFQIARQLAMHP